MIFSLFVSCPKGLEYLLEDELKALGLTISRVSPQGVYGEGNLGIIYQICLWSRIANRVQLILFSGNTPNQNLLYQLCHQFPWQTVFMADKTLAIEFHGSSPAIRNEMFGAQVVKDAVVDYFRDLHGVRPTVARDRPNILLHAHLKNDELTVSLDLVGYSLHQRGYRTQAGSAPLKENLAAAMLIRAQWPVLAEAGYSLQDPFCGSGTFVIEAAMMAAQVAPGLLRNDQSLMHWVQHQASLWEKARAFALAQVKPIKNKLYGSDTDTRAISTAQANAERAGVSKLVQFEVAEMTESKPQAEKGLLICNPPYGERLGEANSLMLLYQQFGQLLHRNYQGWEAMVLTSNPILAKAIGLRAQKQYTFYNGALECKLYRFTLDEKNQLKNTTTAELTGGAQMFANRLQKNYDHLKKWAKKNQISCYRIYDNDLPEYAYAIDMYNDFVVLQEYAPPASIPAHKAEARRLDVFRTVPAILNLDVSHVVIKQRQQQKGRDQYEKKGESRQALIVKEGKANLKLNLYDYLDTGLFLDHRLLRLKFSELAPNTRFLNCFCYTATASVHAALAGALTTNVDLSKTYLAWAEDNFRLNQLDTSRHQFIHYDCIDWLNRSKDRFDVIFLDPPSFSNSKRMTNTLDVQRDHPALIKSAMRLLAVGGCLYFSTNLRHFKLAENIAVDYKVKDITETTIDLDFKRNKRIHQCFTIEHHASPYL